MTPKTVKEIEEEVGKTLEVNQKHYPLLLGKEAEKEGFIFLNHFQNTETLRSIRVLARKERAGDIAVLTRAIFESVLNMGLLLHLPSDEGIDRYKKFLSVELLRTYEHMASIDNEYADQIYAPPKVRLLRKERQEYEHRYEKPKSSWSGMKSIDICKMLDRKYPPVPNGSHFFELMYCQSYRFGSAAVHRSKMGLVQSLQVMESGSLITGESGYDVRSRQEGLIFYYLHGLISFIISMRILGRAFNIDFLEDYFQKRMRSLIGDQPE